MVDHIGLSGIHHHDHNTDGIITSIIGPTVTTATVITSAMTTASASKLAIIIDLFWPL